MIHSKITFAPILQLKHPQNYNNWPTTADCGAVNMQLLASLAVKILIKNPVTYDLLYVSLTFLTTGIHALTKHSTPHQQVHMQALK